MDGLPWQKLVPSPARPQRPLAIPHPPKSTICHILPPGRICRTWSLSRLFPSSFGVCQRPWPLSLPHLPISHGLLQSLPPAGRPRVTCPASWDGQAREAQGPLQEGKQPWPKCHEMWFGILILITCLPSPGPQFLHWRKGGQHILRSLPALTVHGSKSTWHTPSGRLRNGGGGRRMPEEGGRRGH